MQLNVKAGEETKVYYHCFSFQERAWRNIIARSINFNDIFLRQSAIYSTLYETTRMRSHHRYHRISMVPTNSQPSETF